LVRGRRQKETNRSAHDTYARPETRLALTVENQVAERIIDYIVIGAGPAGLQMGYFMQARGEDYLILESQAGPGAFFRTYPRHRKLISVNKRYTGSDDAEMNLRMDWNSLLSDRADLLFPDYCDRYFPDANNLVKYLEDYAGAFDLNIRYETRIQHISREPISEAPFRLLDIEGGQYRCRRLIVATGVSQENLPDIPGIELAETYASASVDPLDYVNQRVLIIGKGNSAFETADNLVETTAAVHVAGPSAIRFAWQTHYVGHLRAVNNNLLDTYQLKSQNAILDGNVLSIKRKERGFSVLFSFARSDEVHKELYYDRVIACTGFRFDHSIFDDSCRPTLTIKDRFPEQTAAWESVSVPDLFFAGTLMQQRDYRKSTSGFIHGFRYCVRSLFNILQDRYECKPWPARTLAATPEALMQAVIERVNRTSALWQQFEFLGDLISFDGGRARYREELPVDYIHQINSECADDYFVVTLEYGPDHACVDPFDIRVTRVAQDDAANAMNAQYLHPVIRHFSRRRLLAEHHVPENLENEWDGPSHTLPLQKFFATRLGRHHSGAVALDSSAVALP
jgi:thioredoxin reductase